MKLKAGMVAALTILASGIAHADTQPQDHAPIGVMGDHNHQAGEWMVSYRYNVMTMDSEISDTVNTLGSFMVAPTEMTMEAHMFGLMYGITDSLTIMGMLPYKFLSMDHVTRMGGRFTTKSDGIGDARLSALYTLYENQHHKFLLNAGVSLPTGSIDERDDTPAGTNQKLPYPMQLGSGTFDLLPGVTYVGHDSGWSWGAQVNANFRLGENDNDYRLGNEYNVTGWLSRQLDEFVSLSLRLDGKRWGDISGADPDLNPLLIPTARPDLRGGTRLDGLLGLNFSAPDDSALSGHRLAIEAGLPLYENVDRTSLDSSYRLMAGWQFGF